MSAHAAAELLARLIAFPTQQAGADGSPGDERALCDFLADQLRARGADEVIVEGVPRSDGTPGAYVFARWGTPRRVINAHVDTVPANAGWSRDPWTAAIEGERVWGLGAADTKGAIAATLCALDGVTPRDAGVLFSGDEEAGSGVLSHLLRTRLVAPFEQVIVCEPTARTAGLAHRGVLACRATLTGPGGHSSRADHVSNPIAKLARFAAALDELGRAYLPRGPAGMTGTCLNLAALAGGIAFNVIPSRGELTFSLRPYPGFPRAAWDAEVAQLAAAIDPAIAIAAELDQPAFACAHPEALAARVRPHVRAIEPLQYWTEAALYAAAGIDAIVVGPGDIARAHAADEYVELADLAWATELYRALLTA